MTVNDILDHAEIQGAVKIKEWDDVRNSTKTLYEDTNGIFTHYGLDSFEREVLYIYTIMDYINDKKTPVLIIEVKAKNE